jgi:hypothetical protein
MNILAITAHNASFGDDSERPEFKTSPQIRRCCHASNPFVILPAIQAGL